MTFGRSATFPAWILLVAKSSDPLERRTVHYSGRVQGVGFRYSASRIARRYAVTGFVQNLPDGRVLLVAEGAADELDRFLGAIAERMSENILDSDCVMASAEGAFQAFDVRH